MMPKLRKRRCGIDVVFSVFMFLAGVCEGGQQISELPLELQNIWAAAPKQCWMMEK